MASLQAHERTRGNWSGLLGFILAAIGSAIGLGNVWRFPYITGEYGGGAFVIVYLVCVFAVGIPIMLAEFLIGRQTQRNCVGAFTSLRPGSPWIVTGWLGIVSGFVILSFYAVVGGWVLQYVWLAVTHGFVGAAPEELQSLFPALLQDPYKKLLWHALFMLITTVIVAGGVHRGIERGNKIMMPLLFALLLVLMIYALRTSGATAALDFLLQPRWDQLTPTAVLEALGQAFFSLSLGMGAMITYGSYLSRDTNLLKASLCVALGDTLVAVLAGLVLFPLVFTFGLAPGAGPGLIFQTLPLAFSQLPGGQWISIAFFILLIFAALTSAMSLLEVVVAYFVDELRWERIRAAWIIGGIIFLCGVPSALSLKALDFMDTLATNYLLPIGALLIALFTGWVLRQPERESEFHQQEIGQFTYRGWLLLLRVVSPVAVTAIFIHKLGYL